MSPHDHDGGLQQDLLALNQQVQRRQALRWLSALGAAGTLPLMGCGGGGDTASTGTSLSGSTAASVTATSASGLSCTTMPEETAGPYPGDGSNTVSGSVANALGLSGINRSDIRSSIAGASGTASGVPIQVVFTLVNVNSSCASLAGYAIYLWHCDAAGRYSMYSSGVTGENYLRGVQSTDANGQATFTSIFPGCYSGRMPHMHFEVYRNANTATSFSNKLKTSQLAFPVATCQEVYNNTSGYSASIANLASISFATDNVFSDGVTLELVSITGSVAAGYTAHIQVAISV
jgi:protocatechuate 3,4-dioxygenase beta subunit